MYKVLTRLPVYQQFIFRHTAAAGEAETDDDMCEVLARLGGPVARELKGQSDLVQFLCRSGSYMCVISKDMVDTWHTVV